MRFRKVSAFIVRVLVVLGIVFGLTQSERFTRFAKAAAPFTAGNVVIYRVGDGSGSLLNTGNPVFLDEYTPAGTFVQSIPVPTEPAGLNRRLIASGTATSEGLLTRSADGLFLILTGYDAAIPTSGLAGTTATSVPRVVGRVDANGNIDTSTGLVDFASANNPRGATSTNGTDLWVAGAGGGARYTTLGATTSTQLSTTVTNLRGIQIFAGQLYVSDSSGSAVRLGAVGTGLPTTSGQIITNLPGFPTTGSPYGFFFADLDGTSGVDTLYVADDTNGAGGGGQLVRVVDTSGYNGAFDGTPTLLTTAATNTAFRGVALTPGTTIATPPSITTHPADKTINTGQTATLSVTATGTAPLSYQWYVGSSGNTSNPINGATGSTFTTPMLLSTTMYWVRVTNIGGSADSNTATVTVVVPPPACTTPFIGIHNVQGSGEISPLAGQTVTVRGVVVGDYEGPSPALRGFYLQDQNQDSDPTTSEGIFIFEGNGNTVNVGDVVQVTGGVEEFQGQTEINASLIENCGVKGGISPVDVALPVPPPVNGVAYLERFEGMLVRFHQTLYVTEHFQLGRFGQIVMSSSGRLPQPTNVVLPGALAQAQQSANDLNRIIVDDELQNQNPDPIKFGRNANPLSASNTLRAGDTATDIVGVMTYTWAGDPASGNAYRLRPINAFGSGVPNFQPANVRPASSPVVGGRLKIVGMNVLNYFLTSR